jgi:hypothetical protein
VPGVRVKRKKSILPVNGIAADEPMYFTVHYRSSPYPPLKDSRVQSWAQIVFLNRVTRRLHSTQFSAAICVKRKAGRIVVLQASQLRDLMRDGRAPQRLGVAASAPPHACFMCAARGA